MKKMKKCKTLAFNTSTYHLPCHKKKKRKKWTRLVRNLSGIIPLSTYNFSE